MKFILHPSGSMNIIVDKYDYDSLDNGAVDVILSEDEVTELRKVVNGFLISELEKMVATAMCKGDVQAAHRHRVSIRLLTDGHP